MYAERADNGRGQALAHAGTQERFNKTPSDQVKPVVDDREHVVEGIGG